MKTSLELVTVRGFVIISLDKSPTCEKLRGENDLKPTATELGADYALA